MTLLSNLNHAYKCVLCSSSATAGQGPGASSHLSTWQTCWGWQTTYSLEVGVHKRFLQFIWQILRFAGVKFVRRLQLVDNLLDPAKANSDKIVVHKTP